MLDLPRHLPVMARGHGDLAVSAEPPRHPGDRRLEPHLLLPYRRKFPLLPALMKRQHLRRILREPRDPLRVMLAKLLERRRLLPELRRPGAEGRIHLLLPISGRFYAASPESNHAASLLRPSQPLPGASTARSASAQSPTSAARSPPAPPPARAALAARPARRATPSGRAPSRSRPRASPGEPPPSSRPSRTSASSARRHRTRRRPPAPSRPPRRRAVVDRPSSALEPSSRGPPRLRRARGSGSPERSRRSPPAPPQASGW